jgi:cyclophilin family peptidyl-prolyl cis-trans isomerase/PKD repeat protein/WD40 repeat protein
MAALFLSACSTPPAIAEFSATSESGNAPLDVSFVLGELADADTFSWDFGDGAGSSELEPSHTFEFSGEFTVRLTATRGDSVDVSESVISVEPGEAGWVVIAGGQPTIASFESTQFTASAFDVLGNPIDDAKFVWSVDADAGDISNSGEFTAATEVRDFPTAIKVEIERLGVTVSEQAGIEIVNGPLHGFTVDPSELDIQVGRSITISVQAVDEAGHSLDSALVLFTALREGDEIDSTGLFTSSGLATEGIIDLISIEVEDDGQLIDAIITGSVRPGVLDQIHVSSLPTTMSSGETHQLVAFGTDRFGNELELDDLIWSIDDSSVGTITDSGLFKAGTVAGEYVDSGISVRGILNKVESVTISPVTIAAGAVETIHIVPDNDSVPIGAGSPFVVLALDENGNVIDIAEEDYVFEYSLAGRGEEVAVFIAGYETGDFVDAITVTLPAGAAGNESALIAQSDINVRQRSSNIIAVEVVDQDGGAIMLIDLETAQISPADSAFTENDVIELSPSWWPDGSRLVYAANTTGSLQIYTLDIDTREIVQLTDFEGGVSMPNVSSDGESITFVSLSTDQWQLYVAAIPEDVAENPITKTDSLLISIDETAQHILPYWSPDGSQILVSQNNAAGLIRVMMFDPAGSIEPELMGPFGTVGFGWTPDGLGIHIGISTEDGGLDIGTLVLESFELQLINTNLEYLIASWSPDDSEIAAIDSLLGAGWLVDADSTGLRRIVDAGQTPTRMSWRPREYGDTVSIPEVDELTMLSAGDAPRAPVGALDTSLTYTAVISTDVGDIEIELFDDLSPMTVENFVNLSRIGYYEGMEFHRVIEGFVSQAGDPEGDDVEGPGYLFNDEFTRELKHDSAGLLSMANFGSNTNGSQFFITHAAADWLDAYEDGVAKNCADGEVSCHSIFGRVTAGLEIATGMAERDPDTATEPGVKILGISITES